MTPDFANSSTWDDRASMVSPQAIGGHHRHLAHRVHQTERVLFPHVAAQHTRERAGGARMALAFLQQAVARHPGAVAQTREHGAGRPIGEIPQAPAGFGAAEASADFVVWSWTRNSDDETGFRLYGAPSPAGRSQSPVRISCMRVVPSRQGVHLPQLSLLMNSMKKRAMSTMHVRSSITTMPPDPIMAPSSMSAP